MTDLIAESQEALRQERLEALARRWGPWALLAAVAVVLGVVAWQGWAAADRAAREARTGAYIAAAEEGPGALAAAADSLGPLAPLARLTAGEPLDEDAPQMWADLARLGAADLTLEQAKAIAGRTDSPWRARAWERAAVLAAQGGDFAAAREFLDEIVRDPAAPGSLKARAQDLATLYAAQAGGGPE
ncbi:MAG: hypothetical protein JKP92_05290 [Alphaproteobacteria bacterium]|jgi:hypothetical protein|nr:hypothetical protein [Alphaproteobacteria bacterium]